MATHMWTYVLNINTPVGRLDDFVIESEGLFRCFFFFFLFWIMGYLGVVNMLLFVATLK